MDNAVIALQKSMGNEKKIYEKWEEEKCILIE